ncbi:MAG: hypothetical protein HXX18_10830 [Bacteroidetes bacterium]|nr:hypothetical protein [Bacteroidota bacterium]
MRKIFTILVTVLLAATVWAQSPNKMSYQAVIRNASNNLVTNTAVAMQISILQGSASGTAVYVETQTPSTNANGLVSIEIGGGTVLSGNFSTINWANGPYFIKTETDPDGATGGISYTISGTSQLLSVPYALHAKMADSISGGIIENDPIFTLWNKNYNDLINKPNIADSVSVHGFNGQYVSLTGIPSSFTPTAHNQAWSTITSKPTTLAGYGITDAFNGTWLSLTGKPSFATVATSGSYNDLSNLPTIINSQWVNSGSDINYSAGNVGIGTATTQANLNVYGSVTVVNTPTISNATKMLVKNATNNQVSEQNIELGGLKSVKTYRIATNALLQDIDAGGGLFLTFDNNYVQTSVNVKMKAKRPSGSFVSTVLTTRYYTNTVSGEILNLTIGSNYVLIQSTTTEVNWCYTQFNYEIINCNSNEKWNVKLLVDGQANFNITSQYYKGN